MKSILFITASNLATNPRCLKEIQLAVKESIEVKVLACKLGGWSQENEKFIQQTLGDKVEIRYADGTRTDKISWLISSFIEKLCSFLFTNLKYRTLRIISYAFSKRSYLLRRELNKTHWIPTLVIAHNPGAFYPAYTFAKINNSLFAVDVEDFHPGERQPLIKRELVTLILEKLLPRADYTSYASPLIHQQCIKKIPGINAKRAYVANNVFWQCEFSLPEPNTHAPLKFVWFSQNIDYQRGLESLLNAFDKLDMSFTLTLIGNVREEFFRNEIQPRNYITLLDPLPQPELHHLLRSYDIGLAVEDVQADQNRAICLTNKIWSYFQSGLYIMATSTPAQVDFINEFPQHGTLVDNSEEAFFKSFLYLGQNRVHLDKLKLERFSKAKDFSWDVESNKLLKVWRELILE